MTASWGYSISPNLVKKEPRLELLRYIHSPTLVIASFPPIIVIYDYKTPIPNLKLLFINFQRNILLNSSIYNDCVMGII